MSAGLQQQLRENQDAAAPRRAALPWLPRVLVESVLIVFSVLLALALDQWFQERERAATAQTARSRVYEVNWKPMFVTLNARAITIGRCGTP
jgi:hypothetical protein